MLEIVPLILVAFENLFGLKINFSKNKIIPLHITNDEGQRRPIC